MNKPDETSTRDIEVSVLMPVFNGERYLADALRSVQSQRFQGFEIIVINDGSTDGTGDMLSRFAHQDPRLRILTQENRGVADARNRGLRATMAPFVASLDADDVAEPQWLATLVEFCESQNLRFTGGNLRAVFVTGELLDDHQRRVLKRFFRAPVANGYGSRDGGFIAHECPQGRMHVMDQNLIVEITDEDGRPVDHGASGEIVITHLDALAMPLLRYRTGDMGMLLDDPCPCGRSMRTMGVVGGRRTDHLVACDGTLKHALAGIYVLRELNTVARFRIHQRADRSVDVYVVPEPGFGPRDHEYIVSGISRQLGSGTGVRVHLVDSISSGESGKFRQVISEAVGAAVPEGKPGDTPGPAAPEPVLV